MARTIVAGIDLGSSEVKAIIAEGLHENGHFAPKIIGTGIAEARGMYRGYVANPLEAGDAIREAVRKAEKTSGVKVKRAYVAVGGIGLESMTSTGSVIISRADLEITDRDLAQALEAAETSIPAPALLNKKIINTIPIEYKADGRLVWGRVEGLKAQKLEVKALFITCTEHHLEDLMRAVEAANIEVVDVVAAPVAASFVTLSKKQKKAGSMLADIGAETLSLVVYENSNLISLAVFPLGGVDITHDIALGLKVTLEEAEGIKLGSIPRISVSKKKLDEIIFARLRDCFEMVQGHLKSLRRDALLPAGAVLTGGTSGIMGIKNFAEEELELPAQVAEIHYGEGEKNKIRDNIWAVACGLTIVGFNSDNERQVLGSRSTAIIAESGKRWARKASEWFSQFLP